MFFDTNAFHFILTPSQGGGSEEYTQVANFKINVQPMSAEEAAFAGAMYGKTYTGFTTYSGLNINDIITLSGTTSVSGTQYLVKGIMDHNSGPLPHFELTLTLPDF